MAKPASNKSLQSLKKGSRRLHRDVEELEDALILHKRFQDDTGVRGMIRKEIGGSIWQHGGAGKLHSYKSTKDLEDNIESGNIRENSKKRVEKVKTSSDNKDVKSTDSSSPDKRGSDLNSFQKRDFDDRMSVKPSRKSVKVDIRGIQDNVTKGYDVDSRTGVLQATEPYINVDPKDPGLSSDQMIGKYNVDKVETLKTKVLERASSNVIQRKRMRVRKKHEEIENEKQNKRNSDLGVSEGNALVERRNVSKHRNSRKIGLAGDKDSENSSKKELCSDKPGTLEQRHKETEQNTYSDHSEETDRNTNSHRSRTPSSNFPKQTNRMLSVDLELLAKSVALNGSESSGSGHFNNSPASSLREQNILRQSTESRSSESSPKCDPSVLLWLRSLGLLEEEKYIHIFAENEIDMEELVRLNGQHLNHIGVVAVGAYNKILRGIQELQQKQTGGKDILASNRENSTARKNIAENISDRVTKVQAANQVSTKSENLATSQTFLMDSLHGKMQKSSRKEPQESTTDVKNSNSKTDENDDRVMSPDRNSEDNLTNSKRPKSSQSSTKASKRNNSVGRCNSASENKYSQKSRSNSSTKQKHKVTSVLHNGMKASSSSAKSKRGKEGDRTDKVKGDNSITNQVSEGRKLPDAYQKLANTGVDDAVKKTEERQKQEIEYQRKREKIKERQKHHRDELARKHEEREKHREEIARRHWEIEKARAEMLSEDEAWSNPGLTLEDLSVESTHVPRTGSTHEKGELRTAGPSHRPRSKPSAVRQSVLVPASALELRSEEMGKNVMLASYLISSRPPKPRSDSPRKSRSASRILESQIESLQTRAVSGDLVTMQLVKDLQLRLDQLENQMTVTDSPVRKRSKMTKKDVHVEGQGVTSGFSAEDVLKMKNDFQSHSRSSGSRTIKSMSKKELLNEIRKEKNEHKKQLRHLHSELSRVNIEEPTNKGSEVSGRDISFNENDLIGEGTFSRVFKGTYQDKDVAIKQLKIPLSAQDRNYFSAEVSLLRDLKHPRVVLMIGVCTSDGLPLMILEYMARGSLYQHLHNSIREELDHVEYFRIAHDMALGMSYLHHQKPAVLHLDLKSMNVLLCSNYRAKIADFGFSKLRHDADVKARKASKSKPVQGSPAWMAPELLETGEITPKADVYSFGVILWEMLTRKQPYEGCSVFQVLERVRLNNRPQLPDNCPGDLVEFVQDCWHANPARRPSFKEILTKLDSLAFPMEWRNLFDEAGVPKEALEDVQSARTIISLVNNTLDTENVKTLVQDIQMSLEEEQPIRLSLSEKDELVRKSVSSRVLRSSENEQLEYLLSDRPKHSRDLVKASATSKSLDERHTRSSTQRSLLLKRSFEEQNVLSLPNSSRQSVGNGRDFVRQNLQEDTDVNRMSVSDKRQLNNMLNVCNNSSQQHKEYLERDQRIEELFVGNSQDSLNSTIETESLPSMDSDSLELNNSSDSLENIKFKDCEKFAGSLNSSRKSLSLTTKENRDFEQSRKSDDKKSNDIFAGLNSVGDQSSLLGLCQSFDKKSARMRFEKSAGSSDHLLSELSSKLKGLELIQSWEDDLTSKHGSARTGKKVTRTAWKHCEENKINKDKKPKMKVDDNELEEIQENYKAARTDVQDLEPYKRERLSACITEKQHSEPEQNKKLNSQTLGSPALVIPPPPPPPPLPATTPRQHTKSVFITPMGVNKDQLKQPSSEKTSDYSEEKVMFLVKSTDLREQKEQLASINKPHPNQLQDLSNVNKVTITSIAEILKKAVSSRRTALGEDTGSPPLSVASSWSFVDD